MAYSTTVRTTLRSTLDEIRDGGLYARLAELQFDQAQEMAADPTASTIAAS